MKLTKMRKLVRNYSHFMHFSKHPCIVIHSLGMNALALIDARTLTRLLH
jgi:hypothetical protein